MKRFIAMVVALCMLAGMMCGCEAEQFDGLLTEVRDEAEHWSDVALKVSALLDSVGEVAAAIANPETPNADSSNSTLPDTDAPVDAPVDTPTDEPSNEPVDEPSPEPTETPEPAPEPSEIPSDDAPSDADTSTTVVSRPQETVYVTAERAYDKLVVNGLAYGLELYEIDDSNYIKLREFAMLLRNSGKRFNVEWNGELRTINLVTGVRYNILGGEFTEGDGSSKQAKLCTSPIYIDGAEADIEAYEIDGYNFVKLRDICRELDIEVSWDAATQTITLVSSSGDNLSRPTGEVTAV